VSAAGIYHFVLPDCGGRGHWYDVKVFASTPDLDPLFHQQFPDHLGIPSDSYSYLSKYGVGLDQQKFPCRTEKDFVTEYEVLDSLLTSVAVPYLDGLQSLEDVLPTIKHPLYFATALYLVGRKTEAKPLIEQQVARIERSGAVDSGSLARVSRLRALLSAY